MFRIKNTWGNLYLCVIGGRAKAPSPHPVVFMTTLIITFWGMSVFLGGGGRVRRRNPLHIVGGRE
jgi:hypothetical protein